MEPEQFPQTFSVEDYAALVEFAEIMGREPLEFQAETIVIIEGDFRGVLSQFNELCRRFSAVINVCESIVEMPVSMGDVTFLTSFFFIRGTGLTERKQIGR